MPILIVVLVAVLIIGGILLYFLVLRGDDSSSSGDSSGGNVVADGGETPAPTDMPIATTEPTTEPTPTPTPTATPEPTPEPTPTPYGATLENINTDLKLNGKSTNVKIGKVKLYRMFNKKGKPVDVPIKIIVKTKRKSLGKRYKVYFDVTYKYLTNPKAKMSLAPKIPNYANTKHYIFVNQLITLFDYETGKSLEVKGNKKKVKMKYGKWKYSYYPKQTYETSSHWYSWTSTKKASIKFSVSYLKTCGDVCACIGFTNFYFDRKQTKADKKYWKGKGVFGKTAYYKKTKDTVSYLLLN